MNDNIHAASYRSTASSSVPTYLWALENPWQPSAVPAPSWRRASQLLFWLCLSLSDPRWTWCVPRRWCIGVVQEEAACDVTRYNYNACFRLDFRLVNLAASDSLDTFAPSLFLANLAQACSRLLAISEGLRGNWNNVSESQDRWLSFCLGQNLQLSTS